MGLKLVSERKRGHQDQRATSARTKSTVDDIERVNIENQVRDGVASWSITSKESRSKIKRKIKSKRVLRGRCRTLSADTY